MKRQSFNKRSKLSIKTFTSPFTTQKITSQSNETDVNSTKFKVENEIVKDVVTVGDKLTLPSKNNLPERGTLGQILYDNETQGFYGWNGADWIALSDTFERISLPTNAPINPNIKTSLIAGFYEGTLSGFVEWANHIGGSYDVDNEYVNTVGINDSDNIVLGRVYYADPAIVYTPTGTVAFTIKNESGEFNYQGAFFLKYDTNGAPTFLGRIGGYSDTYLTACGINNSNYSVATGYYYYNDMALYNNNNQFVTTLAFQGYFVDAYLINFMPNNSINWFTKFYGSGDIYSNKCSINSTGKVLVSGCFYDNEMTIYNAGLMDTTVLSADYNDNNFLIKYTPLGVVEWATKMSGNFIYYTSGLSDMNENENIVAVAKSVSNNDIEAYNADTSSATILDALGYNALSGIFKYSPSGSLDWAAALRNDSHDIGSIAYTNNDIVVVGYYDNNELNIYDKNGSLTLTLPSPNNEDIFVIKYNGQGHPQWAARIGGDNGEYYASVSVNNSGNIVVSGYYESDPLYIYDSTGEMTASLPNDDFYYQNIFVVSYDTTGKVMWATRLGGLEDESTPSIAINNLGNVVVSGTYRSSPMTAYNSDGSSGLTIVYESESGYDNSFIVKYNSCGEISLPNPAADGQEKIIVSNRPSLIVNTDATINGVGNRIQLSRYKDINLVWDEAASNWIVLKNDAQLL